MKRNSRIGLFVGHDAASPMMMISSQRHQQ